MAYSDNKDLLLPNNYLFIMISNNLEYIINSEVDSSSIQLNPNDYKIKYKSELISVNKLFITNYNNLKLLLITTTPLNLKKLNDFIQEYNELFTLENFQYLIKKNSKIIGKILNYSNKSKDIKNLNLKKEFKIIGTYKFNNQIIGYNLVNK